MSTVPYSYRKLNLWLVVNGTEIPVVAARLDFELNGIPRASCVLPVGRDILSGGASPVHTLAALDDLTPAKLMCQVVFAYGDDGVTLPSGTFTLFEGYTAGTGYSRSASPPSAGFTIALTHWASDLNYSSIFSQDSSPTNPGRYSAAAIYGNTSGATVANNAPADIKSVLTDANISQELFQSALLPFFQNLAKQNGLQIKNTTYTGKADNSVASASLARFKSNGLLKLVTGGDLLGGAIYDDLQRVVQSVDELAGSSWSRQWRRRWRCRCCKSNSRSWRSRPNKWVWLPRRFRQG